MSANKMEAVVKITHKRGMHLSPASIFAEKANEFQAEIKVAVAGNPEEQWNGKRVIDLMSIGAVFESEIIISCEGDDAQQAVEALEKLVKRDFGLTQ